MPKFDEIYPAFKVQRFKGRSHYYLVASSTNCVEFCEVRKAGTPFGFSMNALRSRPVVKEREDHSVHMAKELWHVEVKASMLAHLACAMQLVDIADAIRGRIVKPTISDFKDVAVEAAGDFILHKRRLARKQLLAVGFEAEHAQQLLDGIEY